MSTTPEGAPAGQRASLDRLLGELRPRLHRYCARMTGSTIDGEDVVQEALIKAIEAQAEAASIANAEAWLFRIAHNAALDFLRKRSRREAAHADEDLESMAAPEDVVEEREIVAASLRTFMRLPAAQRSSVILMDVLGYTIQEIGSITSSSVPAVKAALHRGRTNLLAYAREPEDVPAPEIPASERVRLAAYIDRFNARDFDAVRDMLAEEVRLELVTRLRLAGKPAVGAYFTNYDKVQDWRFEPGLVDGHPAIVVRDPEDERGRLRYFILLGWSGDKLVGIRDFRFARYAMEGAEVSALT